MNTPEVTAADLARLDASLGRLPVFPLPDVAFFPGTLLPLHVFEPRYRALVQAALDGPRMLSVAMLKPGWDSDYQGSPPTYSVAGAGDIVRAERLGDGRFNIVVRGLARVHFESWPRLEPFRLAVARLVPDVELDAAVDGSLALETRALRGLVAELNGLARRAGAEFDGTIEWALPPGALTNQLAARVVTDAELRQELLAEPRVAVRARKLVSTLADTVARAHAVLTAQSAQTGSPMALN